MAVPVGDKEELMGRGGKKRWGARHTFIAMSFAGHTLCFALRVDMNVAIVAMVGSDDDTGDVDQCPPRHSNDSDPFRFGVVSSVSLVTG